MSLAIYKFQLERFPHYILNSTTMTTSFLSTLSSSPFPIFILCPISVISDTTTNSLKSDTISDGITVKDPVQEFLILRLPEHILNLHLPSSPAAFTLFNTIPCWCIPLIPLPICDIQNYSNKYTHNSIYHITLTNDKPPIILDQPGLDNPKSFLFYLQ